VFYIKKKSLSANSSEIAIIMENIAMVLEKVGKYDESLKIYERIIKINDKNFGEDHLESLLTKENLAILLEK
jgi:tetratricopeptide (TPR) repeat protein